MFKAPRIRKGDESPTDTSPEKEVKRARREDGQKPARISLISARRTAEKDLSATVEAEIGKLEDAFAAPKTNPFAKR